MNIGIRRPSPALVIAVIASVAALTGTAYAALGKNSVGSRQLKAQSVTGGKIANNAVTGAKVANGSLSGSDINVAALGTVPSAANATNAANADTVGGHGAACPGGTVLIRGICFDNGVSEVVDGVQAAADACAAKGGYLPTPLQLYSARNVLNLGTGIGNDKRFTDSMYSNPDTGGNYATIMVTGTGAMIQESISTSARYVCSYPLVR
jgi:hypothetical protein